MNQHHFDPFIKVEQILQVAKNSKELLEYNRKKETLEKMGLINSEDEPESETTRLLTNLLLKVSKIEYIEEKIEETSAGEIVKIESLCYLKYEGQEEIFTLNLSLDELYNKIKEASGILSVPSYSNEDSKCACNSGSKCACNKSDNPNLVQFSDHPFKSSLFPSSSPLNEVEDPRI